jgi:hypothetical protein
MQSESSPIARHLHLRSSSICKPLRFSVSTIILVRRLVDPLFCLLLASVCSYICITAPEHIVKSLSSQSPMLVDLYPSCQVSIALQLSVYYRLMLPSSMKIHPVFHVSLLDPYKPSTILDRTQDPLPPVVVDDELEWEVEEILDSRSVVANYTTKSVGN